MAVWLRYGPVSVGLDDGVLRAADYSHWVSMEEASSVLDAQYQELFSAANERISEAMESAQEQTQKILTESNAVLSQAYDKGFSQGLEDALTQWTQRALEQADESRRMMERQRERLGNIVAVTAERVVADSSRKALFTRALATIRKVMKDTPTMTMRVNVADSASAKAALAAMLKVVPDAPVIEVVTDAALAQGSCLFESDIGVVDASLHSQMAALQRALQKAAASITFDEDIRGL